MIPFERTVCACPDDVASCLRSPGYLLPGDVLPIAEVLVAAGVIKNSAEVLEFLRASRGALVADSATGALFRIGTVTPRMRDGRCVFLDETNRCRVHAAAPFGCAYMSREEGDRRSMWGLRQVMADVGYARLREALRRLHGEEEPFGALLTPDASPEDNK